jgi:hypothetical protein
MLWWFGIFKIRSGEFGTFFPWKILCMGRNHIFQVEIWWKFGNKRNTRSKDEGWLLWEWPRPRDLRGIKTITVNSCLVFQCRVTCLNWMMRNTGTMQYGKIIWNARWIWERKAAWRKKLGFGLSRKNWPTCFFKAKLHQVIKGCEVSSCRAHPLVCRRQNCIKSYTELNSLGSGQSLPTNTIKLAD